MVDPDGLDPPGEQLALFDGPGDDAGDLGRYAVLVACEFTGTVRDAFRSAGIPAVSCDLLPTEAPGPHVTGDVTPLLTARHWPLVVAHPPCTYLAHSGVRWMRTDPERWEAMVDALEFFRTCLAADADRVAVENPIPHKYARLVIGRPTQYVEPHEFGTLETKKTGLWLRNLPPLLAMQDGLAATKARPREERMPGWWGGGHPHHGRDRSRFDPGIAAAMAQQWGALVKGP